MNVCVYIYVYTHLCAHIRVGCLVRVHLASLGIPSRMPATCCLACRFAAKVWQARTRFTGTVAVSARPGALRMRLYKPSIVESRVLNYGVCRVSKVGIGIVALGVYTSYLGTRTLKARVHIDSVFVDSVSKSHARYIARVSVMAC